MTRAAVTLMDIVQAQHRLHPYLSPTPLEQVVLPGGDVWIKWENLNPTHAFKVRGALNALLSLDSAAREHGVIAASSGNHAQALAYASQLVGVKARILMPKHTPQRKVNGVKHWGAEAVLVGDNYDETEAAALHLAKELNRTYVSPYNDSYVVAGAGTIGLEILTALPSVERIICPVGGGGLISGISLAIKALKPSVEIIGVNPESAPAMYNAFYQASQPEVWETLAEALSGAIEEGSITIPIVREHVNRIAQVSEAAIAEAMRWCIETQGWIVEGGAAVGIAALRRGIIPASDVPTVIVVSGGNVDAGVIRQVLGAQ
jgi:threonine dehydratase